MTKTATDQSILTLTAPAKINLALHITGQREDGYHLLESLVVLAVRKTVSSSSLRGIFISR